MRRMHQVCSLTITWICLIGIDYPLKELDTFLKNPLFFYLQSKIREVRKGIRQFVVLLSAIYFDLLSSCT